MFYKSSYERHNEWYNNHFPSAESKTNLYKRNREADKNNLSVWLQDIFFSCLNPLLKNKSNRWLTVGDAYGFDAQYILKSGNEALATDLNTDFLTIAEKEGIISSCSAQNAEKITFPDESFDYVLCKESYHHFPRPYMAVYEMLRVARSGIIIMEPQDPVSKMPLLQFLHNLFASNKRIMSKIWKNRFSYEPVGNFVYKVSEREFEKIAAGLGLRLVAFKKINPNFWFKGAEYISLKNNAKLFKLTKCKKVFRDFLVRLRIIPAQTLVSVIFKTVPDEVTIRNLKQEGYRLVYIPDNPYIS